MAFDQSTRNLLQRFVTDARRTLEEEFTRQLQNDYGLDPVSGTASPLESLRHINDQKRETARILRDTLSHYCASSDTDTKAGLDRIVREQAFTVLNRLAALRMAEARGLLMESVGNGYQAKGFQLYARLAGTGLGETGDAYRVYLQSVFDELSQDLPGLFDRFSPQGRLFPREAALIQVLTLLNHGEIEPLWAEDETIGWIYQYFNSKEERKAMRDASQTPRNSRELAVRNQFFTPRYVVEFLVDNTLGRLWFNWTGGQTGLRDRCQYLLVKPDEQLEPAKRPRDPRTIKLLDPACGSMHFGLYAFDLFLVIYREAWAWEQTHGPGCLDTETGGSAELKPLRQTYADQDTFLHDVPRLIIEHNIYGVDIDPRAAQIASLALWLRAQRAWHEAGVKAKARPQVGSGHVLAAVAPPAEVDLRNRFMEELDPLDAKLFEKTLFLLKDLPELGVLLQVERELPALVRAVFGEHGDLFREQDIAQWQKAEARLRGALTDFARAARSTYQGRLFAEDALQGLKIVDLCSEKFDVVLMNPPFGDATHDARAYIRSAFEDAAKEIANCFVERGARLTRREGVVGAITSRFMLANDGMSKWRRQELLDDAWGLKLFADLGYGVLDDAMVEACAYVVGAVQEDQECLFVNCLDEKEKEKNLRGTIALENQGTATSARLHPLRTFRNVPDCVICHMLPENLLKASLTLGTLVDQGGSARVGLQTGDNERFVRAVWEVHPEGIGADNMWAFFAKGGEYEPYFDDIHLVVLWADDGREIKNFTTTEGKLRSRPQNLESFFKEGITYPDRTTSDFSPRHMPKGVIFSSTGFAIFAGSRNSNLGYLGAAYTRPFKVLIDSFVGSGDSSVSGSAARHYRPGVVNGLANLLNTVNDRTESLVRRCIAIRMHDFSLEETTRFFVGFGDISDFKSLKEYAKNLFLRSLERSLELIKVNYEIEGLVCDTIGASRNDLSLDSLYGSHPENLPKNIVPEVEELQRISNLSEERLIESLTLSHGAGRSTVKKAYFGDRRLELISRMLETHPANIVDKFRELDAPPEYFLTKVAQNFCSYALGLAFGRWQPVPIASDLTTTMEAKIFDELPIYSPAQREADEASGSIGILDHYAGGSSRLMEEINNIYDSFLGSASENLIQEITEALGYQSLPDYFYSPNGFFSDHLSTYSKSRRKAPIYWPISTNSGSYTLWLYYPRLTDQTLFTAVNDFIEPKLKQVGQDVVALRAKGSARSRDDEKSFEALQTLELELIELRDTLLAIAQTYRPNHDDGVQITAAPLWQLFRHKPWQKILKDTWAELEKGGYDWAHLAMAYWPDRVREKCKTDKSLAIAHDLEHLYVEPDLKPTKAGGRKKNG